MRRLLFVFALAFIFAGCSTGSDVDAPEAGNMGIPEPQPDTVQVTVDGNTETVVIS